MHTNYSDGTGSVEEVLRFAQHATPLDVIAITDHDTIEGALRARDLAPRPAILRGDRRRRNQHARGPYAGALPAEAVPPDLSIERSIELVHAQGGLAIVAHPFNRVFRHSVQRTVMNRLLRQPELHPDGIETLNGSFAGIGSSRIAMALARTVYHWAETGGSDAHTTTAVGCARTLFPAARRETCAARFWSARQAPGAATGRRASMWRSSRIAWSTAVVRRMRTISSRGGGVGVRATRRGATSMQARRAARSDGLRSRRLSHGST